MYRRPKYLDERITDEHYEHLMDICSEECDSFLAFGSLETHFERAVLAAATYMLPRKQAELIPFKIIRFTEVSLVPEDQLLDKNCTLSPCLERVSE